MTATVRSNQGDEEVVIHLSSTYTFDTDSGFHAWISISAPHWDGDNYVHPIHLKLEDLCFSREQLFQLSEQLLTWSALPLAEMVASPLVARFELCRLSGQQVAFNFGPREDTIDSHKPVLSVEARIGNVHMGTHFVTDQSCLTNFANELKIALDRGHSERWLSLEEFERRVES